MATVFGCILPHSSAKSEEFDDDYSLDYSFAMEYNGPPLSHDIPQVVPIDVARIPTASMAAGAVLLKYFSLPLIQPIVTSDHHSDKKVSEKPKSGLESQDLVARLGKFGSSSSNSGTLGFSDCLDDSNGSSNGHYDNCLNPTISDSISRSQEMSSEISSYEKVEDCVIQGNRISLATCLDLPSSDAVGEQSDHDEPSIRPMVSNDEGKWLCHRCQKGSRFAEKEVCIVCGVRYCSKCVLRAMGSMPEGRKCITCIGYRIDESKRRSLGKCSRMLKRLLADDPVKQIMNSEISCEVNQLPSHLICVNDKPLSVEELVLLQNCPIPPKKLRPGKYWYDKVSGFWGKEGEKPSEIISPHLALGYQMRRDASNGDTNVMINNREITKAELWLLQAAGIHCEGSPRFWLTADGSYQHEGMKNVMGKLWEKTRVKILCAALCLPFPLDTSNLDGEDVEQDKDNVTMENLEQKTMNKLLLVGCDQSGTSTIFKQAKIVYNAPFSEDEKQRIKDMIQRNIYSYICVLLEGQARFEEEYSIDMRSRCADEPGPSGISQRVDENNIYSFSPKLQAFSKWLLQVMKTGNLEAIFPAATQDTSPLVEELWEDKAFQATYKRRNELKMLSRVAYHFLDRAVEISRIDYEPSEMDILYVEGMIASSNGVASMEFSFPKSSQNEYMGSLDWNDPTTSCQLIRLHPSSLGENCKWLEMFEDINLVIYCVSMTDYDEYYEDINGVWTNKMLAAKKLFETIITHPTLADKDFLLILNKFDLVEEKIERVPLANCEWFQDFNPLISLHPDSPSLAQCAFHYMAVKFKRVFQALTSRNLFVSGVNGLEADSVDKALRYGREILKWNDEIRTVSMHEWSSESLEMSTFV